MWEGYTYHYKRWDAKPGKLVDDDSFRKPIDNKGRYKEQPLLRVAQPILWASDYGSSGTRLLVVSFAITLAFALLYLIPTPAPSWVPSWLTCEFPQQWVTGLDSYQEKSTNKEVQLSFGWSVVRSFYFSLTIMTGLGFDEVSPYPKSGWGYFLVGFQVCIGYALLGALITRLAILFQEVE